MSVRLFACSIHLLSRLYFLYSARLTFGSLCSNLCSICSIRRVIADTVVLFMPLFFIYLYFISAHWRRFAALRHVCDNDEGKAQGQEAWNEKK